MNIRQQRRQDKKAERRRKRLKAPKNRKQQLPAGHVRCELPLCPGCDPVGWTKFCNLYGVGDCPGCWPATVSDACVELQERLIREREGKRELQCGE